MNDHHQPHVSDLNTLPSEATRRGQDCEAQVQQALSRHRESVLPAILERHEHRQVRAHQAAELALGFEHRRQAIAMALESRLQSIREACNHVLVTGKTHLRQQRIEYFGEVYRQLEQRMNNLTDDYLAEADRRYARLQTIQNEHLRRREQQRQEKAADDFLDTMDQLMDEFRSIISEHVDHRASI
ncbi:hypothetical protein CKO25_11380 [Thiocapsa imhoffii]|uniref:Uncharacterized protein n=1 Tax=Thiocapsa imhoffii TaxID=382777 RepID=A0A9X0WJE0_9GAMM|nr:hypothetical protein [Thiocapsa imhoffii]MBK1645232.1 hypothetical protein [Thiocapsa imhoffii]